MLFSIKNQCFEVKKLYNGSEKKFPCQLLYLNDGLGIIKYLMKNDYQLEHIYLPKGTISLGFFWKDRNYNVYQWYSEGKLLASYFNVSNLPKLSIKEFIWQDLILDILVDNLGNLKLLDEHELIAVKNMHTLQLIQKVKNHILQNYKNIIAEIIKNYEQIN